MSERYIVTEQIEYQVDAENELEAIDKCSRYPHSLFRPRYSKWTARTVSQPDAQAQEVGK